MPEDKDLDNILNPDDFDDDFDDDDDGKSETDDETEKESNSKTETDDDAKSEDDDEEQKRINARNAERRRKRQAKEKERLEREQQIRDKANLEGQLEVLKINPYTHEKIEDEEDLKIYKLQKEIDDNDGDPIADLPKKIAENNRKLAKEKEEKIRADSAEQEKINKDIADFKKSRPDVDTKELAEDKDFMEFADKKLGRWTFEEIYDAYQNKLNKDNKVKTEKETNEKIKVTAINKTKVPSSKSNGTIVEKKVSEMSDEEFSKYWNENYR